MVKIIGLLVLFIVMGNAFASQRTDSLESLLRKSQGANRLNILIELGEVYYTIEPERSIKYSQDAIALSKQNSNIDAELKATINLAIAYAILNHYDEARRILLSAADVAIDNDNKASLGKIYNALGNIAREMSDLPLSIEYYHKALEIRKELKDTLGISAVLNNIGLIYYHKGILERAVGYYEESLKIGEKMKDPTILASTYLNLGNIYNEMNKTGPALEMYNTALSLRKSVGDKIGAGTLYTNIGNIYFRLRKYDTALACFQKSLTMAESVNDKSAIAGALANIGILNLERNKLNEVMPYLSRALLIAQEIGKGFAVCTIFNNIGSYYIRVKDYIQARENLEKGRILAESQNYRIILRENYELLSEVYEKLGDFEQSLFYHKLFARVDDSLFNAEISKKLTDMEVRYSIEKQEKENLILKKDKQAKDFIVFLLILLIFLLILSVIAVYSRFVNKKRTGKVLEQKNKELEIANSSKDMYLSIINKELSLASDYVSSLIPKPIEEGIIRTSWKFVPSEQLGGDSFGYHWIDSEHFAIYLLDVSGHGIGSALHSVSVINALKSETLPGTDFRQPDQVLNSLNRAFQMKNHYGFYFTIWYGVFNKISNELKYASAGHPPALLLNPGAKSKRLYTQNVFIGGMKKFDYKMASCTIAADSELYIFSDGVYEIQQSNDELWDIEGLCDFIQGLSSNGNNPIEETYEKAVNLRASEKLDDDFSLLRIKIV